MERLTLDKIKTKLSKISPHLQILSEKYTHTRGRLTVKCNSHNVTWETNWERLNNGVGCKICATIKIANKRKHSLEYIRQELLKINNNIEILSDNYTNARTKLSLRCLFKDCNYCWEATWDSLHSGHGCPKCATKQTSDGQRYNINTIKTMLRKINPNIEILSNVYIDSKSHLNLKCLIDGHEWSAKWSNLQARKGCPKCGGAVKWSIDTIKEYISVNNPNIELMSNYYKNASLHLKWKCRIDGHVWSSSWTNTWSGCGCPECAKLRMAGEGHPNWKGGITPLHNYIRNNMIKEWKIDSMSHCEYKCVLTSSPFEVIHHPYSFSKILEETMDILRLNIRKNISNYSEKELLSIKQTCLELHYKYGLGICLIQELHNEFHNLYGKGENTIEQWKEYVDNYYEVS